MKCLPPWRVCLLIAAGCQSSAIAETTILEPIADTSINEHAPDFNFGAHSHVAAGTLLQLNGEVPYRTRGLFKFDLSVIPPAANITSVKLTLQMAFNPPGGPTANFGLYRVAKAWWEGTKIGNGGQPSEAGEASWDLSEMPSNWEDRGGDFVIPSSGAALSGTTPGPVIWKTQGMVEDARFWLANPSQNFGWLLKPEDETVKQTAKRWGSKESDEPPRLQVDWNIDLPVELRITNVHSSGSTITLSYTGPQRVWVQTKATIDGLWQTLPTQFSASPITLPISGTQGFFRLMESL